MAAQWYQAIHLTKRYRLGAQKKDISGATFIYGSGVASLGVGDWVVFNSGSYAPVRILGATPSTGQVGISCAANTATTSFSWFMVAGATAQVPGLAGLVRITSASYTDKSPVTQSTAGLVIANGVVATKTVVGAWAVGAATGTDLGNALLYFPTCAGASLA